MRELKIVPITLKEAKEFVDSHHRHNKAPVGHKFSIGVRWFGVLVGVAVIGRPIARHMDDGVTAEVSRTCTIGVKNANSMLYGAAWRAAKAMGYERMITYTQHGESGASLRGAGWAESKILPARKGWADSSIKHKRNRDPIGNGGVERVRWEITQKKPR